MHAKQTLQRNSDMIRGAYHNHADDGRSVLQDYVNKLAMCLLEANGNLDLPNGQRLKVHIHILSLGTAYHCFWASLLITGLLSSTQPLVSV
jgi:hypothetical protein